MLGVTVYGPRMVFSYYIYLCTLSASSTATDSRKVMEAIVMIAILVRRDHECSNKHGIDDIRE